MIKIKMGTEITVVITSTRRGAQRHKLKRDMKEWFMTGALTWGQLTCPLSPGSSERLAMSRHTFGSYNY